jgi:hypothetical protein
VLALMAAVDKREVPAGGLPTPGVLERRRYTCPAGLWLTC